MIFLDRCAECDLQVALLSPVQCAPHRDPRRADGANLQCPGSHRPPRESRPTVMPVEAPGSPEYQALAARLDRLERAMVNLVKRIDDEQLLRGLGV